MHAFVSRPHQCPLSRAAVPAIPIARAVVGTCMHSRAAAPAIPIAPIIIVEPALEEGERVVPAWQSVAISGNQRSS